MHRIKVYRCSHTFVREHSRKLAQNEHMHTHMALMSVDGVSEWLDTGQQQIWNYNYQYSWYSIYFAICSRETSHEYTNTHLNTPEHTKMWSHGSQIGVPGGHQKGLGTI